MKKLSTKLLSLGNDPEVFVFDTKLNEFCSAVEILKRDKHNPIQVKGKPGYQFYFDNTAIEGNIPAAHSKDEQINNLRTLFQAMAERLGSRYQLKPQAAHIFDSKYLQSEGSQRFGCEASYDAWRMEMKESPSAENKNLRSTGFHIHIGRTDFKNFEDGQDGVLLIDQYNKPEFIKLMEVFVGLPLCAMNNDPTDIQRRNLYGQSSEFRPTRYGIEYRVPGPNFSKTPKKVELVYDLIMVAANHLIEGNLETIVNSFEPDDIINTINTCDNARALKLLETLKGNLPAELHKSIKNFAADKKDYDFYKEWNLK